MQKYNNGIYLGKFFPFHEGHLKTLDVICEVCDKVYLVFFWTKDSEKLLSDIFDYSLNERISDVRKIFGNRNVEIIKYNPGKLKFPNDFLEIKSELLKILGEKSIDIQIFGKDDETLYKDYIYADNYIIGKNIEVDGVNLHANLIRCDYDKYKNFLHPIVRKRLDEKLKR